LSSSLGTAAFIASYIPSMYRKAEVVALSLTTAINIQLVLTFPEAVKDKVIPALLSKL
jgi:hypothetical protein